MMLTVRLLGRTLRLAPPRSAVHEIVPSPTGSCTSVGPGGVTLRYDLVPRTLVRDVSVLPVDPAHAQWVVAAHPEPGRFHLGALVLAEKVLDLAALPGVRTEADLRARLERDHPEALGKPAAVSASAHQRCLVLRLDYGALEYVPGNTFDYVLPVESRVGAFSVGPSHYLDLRWGEAQFER